MTVEFPVRMQDSIGIGKGINNPEIEKGCGNSLGKDPQLDQETRSACQLCRDQQDK